MEIQLRNQKQEVVDVAFVSPEDYEKVNKYKWNVFAMKKGKQIYAKGYVNGRSIKMHQLIMGEPPNKKLVIDHENNNGLDNRRSNLRFVSFSANAQNKHKKKGTKNKFIGVQKVNGRFRVVQGGKCLGTFDDEMEAVKHYDKYVTIKYNGVGRTNFPVSPSDIIGVTLDDLTPKNERSLPKHISFNKKSKKYIAVRSYKGKQYKSILVKTLDEAIQELEKLNVVVDELHDKFIKEHNKKAIKRNEKNEAIILVKKTNEDVYDDCIVDDKYWHELSLLTWHMSEGYAKTSINKKCITMHYFLMAKMHTNINVIDHINNIPLDNRLSNLRVVSATINAHNKTKKIGCTSNYIGVFKIGDRWCAQISNNYKRKRTPLFNNEIDAAKAYNELAKEVYGEHANLNNIPN